MRRDSLEIKNIFPQFGIEGGLVSIECQKIDLSGPGRIFPVVHFGKIPAQVVSASAVRIIAQIPAGVTEGLVSLTIDSRTGPSFPFPVGMKLAEELHPVANPAVARDGTIYTTFSGPRGQRVEFSLFKVAPDGTKDPLPADVMNPTGLAFDRRGHLYVSSRHNGAIYRSGHDSPLERFVGDLGIATGLAFDRADNLYVGDRNGVIYRVTPKKEISEFAKLEPSVSAYHLAFGPEGYLYVSGPTISTRDHIYVIDESGAVSIFFSGLGRPQGLVFDADGALYVGASYKGKKGVFRLTAASEITHFISAPVPVGMAFDATGGLIVADNESLYRVPVDRQGVLV